MEKMAPCYIYEDWGNRRFAFLDQLMVDLDANYVIDIAEEEYTNAIKKLKLYGRYVH